MYHCYRFVEQTNKIKLKAFSHITNIGSNLNKHELFLTENKSLYLKNILCKIDFFKYSSLCHFLGNWSIKQSGWCTLQSSLTSSPLRLSRSSASDAIFDCCWQRRSPVATPPTLQPAKWLATWTPKLVSQWSKGIYGHSFLGFGRTWSLNEFLNRKIFFLKLFSN